jgi:hypothetical protein
MRIYISAFFFLFVTIVLGFSVYCVDNDATQNLLAEGAGSFFSIFLAILVVNKMQDSFRAKQWKKVRMLTYRSLSSHISDALSQIYIFLPFLMYSPSDKHMSKIISGRNEPTKIAIEGINELILDLEKNKNYSTREKSFSDLCVEYYGSSAKWDLDQITNSILPRVMQESTDQEVIDALVRFDSVYREFINAIISHREVRTHDVAEPFINLVTEFGLLYQCIEKAWYKNV